MQSASSTSHFSVPTIECEGCANSIKRSVGKLSGIQTIDVNVEKKTVQVAYDSGTTSEPQIVERIEKAGHTVSK